MSDNVVVGDGPHEAVVEEPEGRPAPRPGPGAHHHRPADGRARRHHRQHRPAVHRQGPRHQRHQPDLDRHRLHAGLRRAAAARRPAGRPLRPPPHLHDRPGRLRRRLDARWPGHQRDAAARRPWPPGLRRGARVPRRPGADHHHLPGRPRPQPGVRRVRRHVRRRRGRRPDPRWLADRLGLLALRRRHPRLADDLPHQRADRHRRPPSWPRASCPSRSRTSGQLDVPGAITGTGGLLAIVYGLTHAGNPSYGWGDPWTITSLVAGVILLALFIAVESRVEHPLLPFRIFANRTRAASFVAMALLPAAMFAMFFFLSLFIQNVMGYSPLKTGVAFLPFSAGIVHQRGDRVQPGEPLRRPLHRRRRHARRRRRPVRVLPAHRAGQRQQRPAGRHQRSAPRRRRQLLDAGLRRSSC